MRSAVKVVIPTCKPDISNQIAAINATAPGVDVISSHLNASAAVNRNYCLAHVAEGEIAIMLDDDISGFYQGWHHDLALPLSDPSVVMVSARLMTPDGMVAQTCSMCYDLEPTEIPIIPTTHCVLPTAAIAFRHLGIRFDERYKGSGWEDNDWCFQFLRSNPAAKFIQSNRCRLIHANEQKNQGGPNWIYNKGLFEHKWLKGRQCVSS